MVFSALKVTYIVVTKDICYVSWSRNSVVCIVIILPAGQPTNHGSTPGRSKRFFLFFKLFRSVVWSTHLPLQLLLVPLSPGARRLGREAWPLTFIQLVSMLRMDWAMTPVSRLLSWCVWGQISSTFMCLCREFCRRSELKVEELAPHLI